MLLERRSTLGALSLDTPLYNSMTTACDILWAGVPLVTIPGLKMASRLGASLIAALGVDLLIARNTDDYVSVASLLASGAARKNSAYARVRDAVGRARMGSALFDMEARAGHLGTGIRAAWELYRAKGGSGDGKWRRNVVVAA